MQNQFSRTEALIGEQNVLKLSNSKVAIFGIGGVGSYAVEALARCGIGYIDLIDGDIYSLTNINRQLYAMHTTLGKYKTEVAKQRILDINSECLVNSYNMFFSKETSQLFNFSQYDYIVDAIDSVQEKIELIVQCKKHNVPIISSMGAGNKLHPEMFEIDDIYKTSVCPLAKIIRQELKKRNIDSLRVVYSKEKPFKTQKNDNQNIIGSISFVPATVGLIIAGDVIRKIINFD